MAFMPGRTNVRFWVKLLWRFQNACVLRENMIAPFWNPISLSFDRLLYKRHLLHQAIKTRQFKIKCDKSSWRQLWSLIKTGIISISFQLLQSQELYIFHQQSQFKWVFWRSTTTWHVFALNKNSEKSHFKRLMTPVSHLQRKESTLNI